MTTTTPDVPVRSMQDIVNALERHPEWRSALRTHLLGEELIELPALFAKFATETTRRLDRLTSEVETLKTVVAQLTDDVSKLTNHVRTLTHNVGDLKGAHAEARATTDIAFIAYELGLEYQRTIDKIERHRLAKQHGADVASDEIKSFVHSDIIAEAADDDGNTIYIAVEASYTADHQDADRAQRHAELMRDFTGSPCRAVVASVRNTDRMTRLIEEGDIFWHQLRVRIQPAA